MSLYYQNEQTGAEMRLGRQGLVSMSKRGTPIFSFHCARPMNGSSKTLRCATYELLRTVVSAGSQRESTVAR